jgi:tetratricopeptide (TPR) repeat protein
MLKSETSRLLTAIAHASDLSFQLISKLNEVAKQYNQSHITIPPEDLANLKSARDTAFARLQELAGECKPDAKEWQALLDLQKQDCEVTLANLNSLVAAEPQNPELRYHRAVVLAGLGQNDPAKQDFLDVLIQDATHFGTLIDFGNLLLATGYISAARSLYQQAIVARPEEPLGHVNLANLLQSQSEFETAKQHYLAALTLKPDLAEAHQGLSYVLNDLGEESVAAAHREMGFREQKFLTWPYKGYDRPLAILILSSALGGNIPLKHILDDRTFDCTLVFTEYFSDTQALPPHNLIFNAIGDADLCSQGLTAALNLSAKSQATVLNAPSLVQLTGRMQNATRLRHLPGVISPRSALFPRETLLRETAKAILQAQGLNFPLLLRSPGFHTGQFFQRIETAGDLSQAVNALPGQSLLAIELLDARNSAGDFHKYRVMFVDGKLYPLHLAVSKHWKVHYFTANMSEQAQARRLEQEFLNDMPAVLGQKAISALENICRTLALDYAGIDFALGADGEILLFEANATMVIPRLEIDDKWLYRKQPTEQLLAAVRNMVIARATAPQNCLSF